MEDLFCNVYSIVPTVAFSAREVWQHGKLFLLKAGLIY